MKAEYEVLERVHLPFIEKTKEPGATITRDELEAAKQTEDDVKALVRDKAIR